MNWSTCVLIIKTLAVMAALYLGLALFLPGCASSTMLPSEPCDAPGTPVCSTYVSEPGRYVVQYKDGAGTVRMIEVDENTTDTGFAGRLVVCDCTMILSSSRETEADLRVTKHASPDPVTVGTDLTYTIVVHNDGPLNATGVIVTDTLPMGVTLVSLLNPDSGTCQALGNTVTCSPFYGRLPLNTDLVFTIVVRPTVAGTITNTVNVRANEPDPHPANNTATVTTTVVPAGPSGADLAVTKSASPNPVSVGSFLSYTIVVTNNGPAGATGVTLTDTLAPNVLFYFLGTVSQGHCTTTGGFGATVTCALGALARGASATVTFSTILYGSGTIANTVRVAGNEPDPNPANNTFTLTTTVQ